jgi:hypothetical protein
MRVAEAEVERLRKALDQEVNAVRIAVAALVTLSDMAKAHKWLATDSEQAELIIKCMAIAAKRGEGKP